VTHSIVEVLEQTAIWRGQDGHTYYVGELDDEYLGNIIAYLNRHAERLLEHRRWYDEHVAPPIAVTRTLELEDADALAWLHDRPLYRTLLAEQRRRGAVDGDVVIERPSLGRGRTLDESMTTITDGYGDALRELGER
jgi:hypothetical protein